MQEASGSNRFQGFDVFLTTNGFDPLGPWPAHHQDAAQIPVVAGVVTPGPLADSPPIWWPALFLNGAHRNPLRCKPFEQFGLLCRAACEEEFLILFCRAD